MALLLEWREFAYLEPFGSQRDNWHAAMIASILANAHRDPQSEPMGMDRFFYLDPESAREAEELRTLAALRTLKGR